MTIWKFPLIVADEQTILMPDGARILSVGVQVEQMVLWALVDPEQPMVNRVVSLRGTGHPSRGVERMIFIGTVLLMNGQVVFHVFVLGPNP